MTALAMNLEPSQKLQTLLPTANVSSDLQEDAPLGSKPSSVRSQSRPFSIPGDDRNATVSSLPLSENDTAAAQVLRIPLPPGIPLPRHPAPRSRFLPLQKWEGIVLSIQSDSFTARLVDKTVGEPDEEAKIPLSDVTDDDRSLVQPGAIFYWTIGYSMDLTGSRRRVAEMRFRRLPAWTKRELDQARSDADRTIEALGWDK